MPPTYYRGCWHVVSRDFLVKYRQRMNSYSHTCSSLTTELYEPKPFFTHAVLLHQACAHCGRFPTAASRRSMGRVSVPLWPISLSTRLCIIALVGRYPTNKLMHRRSSRSDSEKPSFKRCSCEQRCYAVLASVSKCCPRFWAGYLRVTHPSATRWRPKSIRCKHHQSIGPTRSTCMY